MIILLSALGFWTIEDFIMAILKNRASYIYRLVLPLGISLDKIRVIEVLCPTPN